MAVRQDYAAPTELENLVVPISTNMPRLTALGTARRRDGENGHRDGRAPQQCPSRAANGSLGWTNGFMPEEELEWP